MNCNPCCGCFPPITTYNPSAADNFPTILQQVEYLKALLKKYPSQQWFITQEKVTEETKSLNKLSILSNGREPQGGDFILGNKENGTTLLFQYTGVITEYVNYNLIYVGVFTNQDLAQQALDLADTAKNAAQVANINAQAADTKAQAADTKAQAADTKAQQALNLAKKYRHEIAYSSITHDIIGHSTFYSSKNLQCSSLTDLKTLLGDNFNIAVYPISTILFNNWIPLSLNNSHMMILDITGEKATAYAIDYNSFTFTDAVTTI